MHFEFLPNEILIECFQYLNAPDIFHSFDQLNSRFSKLLRNIPLHLNFQRFKTNLFYEFCQIILSNPEIKQNIISLRLSNDGRCGQIKSFLSLISLNEFIHLRSLSFIDFNRHNTEQLLPILPFLSNLYYFSFTFADDKSLKIIPILFQFKIRILTIPTFNSYLRSIDKTMSVTSLTISEIHLLPLYKLLEYVPMLKYLQIKDFDDSDTEDDTSNLIHRNAVYLKTFIVDYSNVEFHIFEFLLKCFPNLKTFSIMNSDEIEMIDANRWQYLIESSLPYLHTFKFNFLDYSHTCYDEKVIKLQLFQTDFWTKQHQWYIDFEIDCFSAAVYTIPYVSNEYKLYSIMNRYENPLISTSNRFDNVKKLSLEIRAISPNSLYYFKNVQSLIIGGYGYYNNINEYKLSTRKLEVLDMIVNLSNIKKLRISDERYITSLVLLELLKKLSSVSSLSITTDILKLILTDRSFCEYSNKKIKTLIIPCDGSRRYIPSNQINLFCQIFSNIEYLQCYLRTIDDLLLILKKCSKLSMIKLDIINQKIYSWIQTNASMLNVYITFTRISGNDDDDDDD